MNKRVLTLLGFAAKAAKLSCGFDAAVTAIKKGKSKLVLLSDEISPKSRKEIEFFATRAKINVMILNEIDIETLSLAVGKKCGIISVNDIGFAMSCSEALIEGGNANDQ